MIIYLASLGRRTWRRDYLYTVNYREVRDAKRAIDTRLVTEIELADAARVWTGESQRDDFLNKGRQYNC